MGEQQWKRIAREEREKRSASPIEDTQGAQSLQSVQTADSMQLFQSRPITPVAKPGRQRATQSAMPVHVVLESVVTANPDQHKTFQNFATNGIKMTDFDNVIDLRRRLPAVEPDQEKDSDLLMSLIMVVLLTGVAIYAYAAYRARQKRVTHRIYRFNGVTIRN